jgi:hypothetical protein
MFDIFAHKQDILKEKMDAHMILQGFELFLPEFFHTKNDTYAQLCGYISGGGVTMKTEKVCLPVPRIYLCPLRIPM